MVDAIDLTRASQAMSDAETGERLDDRWIRDGRFGNARSRRCVIIFEKGFMIYRVKILTVTAWE